MKCGWCFRESKWFTYHLLCSWRRELFIARMLRGYSR